MKSRSLRFSGKAKVRVRGSAREREREREAQAQAQARPTCIVRYNVCSLVQYLLASGDFRDPQSRVPFSTGDLRRLDAAARADPACQRLKLGSVEEARAAFESDRADRKFAIDAIVGLERVAGELGAEMMRAIEAGQAGGGGSGEHATGTARLEIKLLTGVFPEFEDVLRQMRCASEAGAEAALQTLVHMRLYLRGPPNKPTRDVSGVLPMVLRFLRRIEQEHKRHKRDAEAQARAARNSDDSNDSNDSNSEEGEGEPGALKDSR